MKKKNACKKKTFSCFVVHSPNQVLVIVRHRCRGRKRKKGGTYRNPRLAKTHLAQHWSVRAARRLLMRNAAALRFPRVCRARKQRNAAWMQLAAVWCRLFHGRGGHQRGSNGCGEIQSKRGNEVDLLLRRILPCFRSDATLAVMA